MQRTPIQTEDFTIHAHCIWEKQWLLLTCGDFAAGRYNTMTVGWGSFGTMWHKPFAQVVIRPSRFTYEFMQEYSTFTLSAFPPSHRSALQMLGTKSGRDSNKIEQAGLTPEAAGTVAAPCFSEAELVVECRTMYWDDLNPAYFHDPSIGSHYPEADYHRMYFGEIVAVAGIEKYKS